VDTPLPIRWPNSAVLLAEIAHHSVVSCTDTASAVLPLALRALPALIHSLLGGSCASLQGSVRRRRSTLTMLAHRNLTERLP